jgi:uncharacterized protein with von Willebrand factor type A (vWA) domain
MRDAGVKSGAPMSRLLDNLLLFGRILRRAGLDVHAARLLDLVDALGHVDLSSREDVYHACRTLLVHRPEQIAIFDSAFAAFWQEQHHGLAAIEPPPDQARGSGTQVGAPVPAGALIAASDDDNTSDRAPISSGLKIWSDVSVLAEKDFAALTAAELAEARVALSRLVWTPGERRTRRWVAGHGPRLDIRRAIADSVRTGGDVVRLRRQKRRLRVRPLVLLCDVSGSMERYSRVLLHFAHAITARHRRVEAFLFSTQLSHITRQLRLSRSDDALAAVSHAVSDWSGGTRIGAALKTFRQHWSRRVLHGGPIVLLVSDGWDRGDPHELADQVAWLQRSCRRLIWLNPLIGTVGYAPLTRGLQAALPFVDDFLPVRTLTNLRDLAAHLNALA